MSKNNGSKNEKAVYRALDIALNWGGSIEEAHLLQLVQDYLLSNRDENYLDEMVVAIGKIRDPEGSERARLSAARSRYHLGPAYVPADPPKRKIIDISSNRTVRTVTTTSKRAAPKSSNVTITKRDMIYNELFKNGPATKYELADKLNISHQYCYNNLRKLQDEGAIDYLLESSGRTRGKKLHRYHIVDTKTDRLINGHAPA